MGRIAEVRKKMAKKLSKSDPDCFAEKAVTLVNTVGFNGRRPLAFTADEQARKTIRKQVATVNIQTVSRLSSFQDFLKEHFTIMRSTTDSYAEEQLIPSYFDLVPQNACLILQEMQCFSHKDKEKVKHSAGKIDECFANYMFREFVFNSKRYEGCPGILSNYSGTIRDHLNLFVQASEKLFAWFPQLPLPPNNICRSPFAGNPGFPGMINRFLNFPKGVAFDYLVAFMGKSDREETLRFVVFFPPGIRNQLRLTSQFFRSLHRRIENTAENHFDCVETFLCTDHGTVREWVMESTSSLLDPMESLYNKVKDGGYPGFLIEVKVDADFFEAVRKALIARSIILPSWCLSWPLECWSYNDDHYNIPPIGVLFPFSTFKYLQQKATIISNIPTFCKAATKAHERAVNLNAYLNTALATLSSVESNVYPVAVTSEGEVITVLGEKLSNKSVPQAFFACESLLASMSNFRKYSKATKYDRKTFPEDGDRWLYFSADIVNLAVALQELSRHFPSFFTEHVHFPVPAFLKKVGISLSDEQAENDEEKENDPDQEQEEPRRPGE